MPALLKLGSFYHIYNRGNNREDIFHEEQNYVYFLKLYTRHVLPVADTFSYCLLRNHFHLLLRIKTTAEQQAWCGTHDIVSEQNLPVSRNPSRAFANLFDAYAKAFNRKYSRTGALFQRPFKRIEVAEPDYLTRLIAYIHQNPQRHGFAADFRHWPFSSYQTMISSRPTNMERETVLQWFGSQDNFETTHQQMVDDLTASALPADWFLLEPASK